MLEGHILKILSRQQSNTRQSKRFCPQQTYGYSKQSPDWFRRKFSLQNNSGYEYKYDEPKFRDKFNYISQKHSFKINKQEDKKFSEEIQGKNILHNRKKGLLSEYLDNNSGMKNLGPLTGFERDQEGRRLNNQIRDKNIETIRMKKSTYITSKTATNFYTTQKSDMQASFKTRMINTVQQNRVQRAKNDINPEMITLQIIPSEISECRSSRSKSIAFLMGQKQKIRNERNKINFNKIHKIQKVKFQEDLLKKKFRSIDSQFVKERMALTCREWSRGRTGSPTKSIQRFDSIIGSNTDRIKGRKINFGMNKQNYNSIPQSENLLKFKKFQSTQL